MFKCCQSCIESVYWNCCEERFCYDESIAKYNDDDWENGKCYTNHIGSVDSLSAITRQPSNNNNLPFDDTSRLVMTELPILAPDIYKVFANSMIFRSDPDTKKDVSDNNNYNSKSTDYNGHIGKVTFKNDSNEKNKKENVEEAEEKKFSDFEIMFQDELFPEHKMFKIEEEEEEENDSVKSPASPNLGLTMDIKLSGVTESLPDSLDKKHEKAIDTPSGKQILRVDSVKSIIRENSITGLPRTKSSALLSRTDSMNSFGRSNSRPDLMVRRVDSMKNLENKNFKNVLARLPPRSASFLSIPDLLNEKQEKATSGSIFSISGEIDGHGSDEHSQISRMPDTPVIKGSKFPKFFAETPVIGEYKADTSLQSIAQSPDVIFVESDFSMPRYYGKAKAIAIISDENTASRSLPDLHEAGNEKMSKRLAKLGSRLKPLIIKKHDDVVKHHSQQNL